MQMSVHSTCKNQKLNNQERALCTCCYILNNCSYVTTTAQNLVHSLSGLNSLQKPNMIHGLGELKVSKMPRAFGHANRTSFTLKFSINGTQTWITESPKAWAFHTHKFHCTQFVQQTFASTKIVKITPPASIPHLSNLKKIQNHIFTTLCLIVRI